MDLSTLTVTPGPIVELKVIPFINDPLEPDGFAFATASINAFTFSTN